MGKSSGSSTTYTSPVLTQEQKDQIALQNEFFKNTIAPTYKQIVEGATNQYNLGAPGVTAAAQNLGQVAGQAQKALGETGESALRTGVSGLQGLFDNNYVNQQLQAAMMPAQAQYQQNLAGLNAGFGGAGQLGSARQALANTQLAGQTQAAQMAAAANVLKDIQAGRLAAGQSLAGLGQGGLGQAIGAAGTRASAAQMPLAYYNTYASVPYGAPQGAWNPNFAGTQGQSQSGSQSGWQFKI